ncbi:TonB-dependent receptor [Steroidobacter sp. S1-65]|uniref:TonB-dependent receptor n=1 Tax=Steroidobacter gossypii TaxID=2805490 RepID=A0ABS1WVE4_9GAMM|nr:TonB-dependent receptor [Steroidobacter gossypii]MBM0104938.1 TonB-dependent receptor [Steroidobacter gossypii]
MANAQTEDLAELSIEQLLELKVDSIYSASKYEQPVTRAPSSISIVTADEIRKSGHRTLDEVLRSVRGLFVSNDRNYGYLGFRGFQRPGDYTSRVLVLVDGHRINDNVGDAGMVDRTWMVDVDLIERVEVIRGPGSSLYGSSAFFGVVNVITKRGRHVGGLEAEGSAGSLNTYSGRLTYGTTHSSGFDWLMSGSHYDSAGASRIYYPAYDQRISDAPGASNDGFADDLDGEQASKFFTSLRYGGLSASMYYNHREKAVPTAPFGTLFNDPENRTIDRRSYADVKYQLPLSDDLQLSARAFYDNYTYEGFHPYNLAAPGEPVDRTITRYDIVGEWVGTEAQLTTSIADRHTLVLGGEFREHLREDQLVYDISEPGNYHLEDRHSSRMYGLFAQSETKLRENLSLTLGLRLDDYSAISERAVTPRVGLVYNPTELSAVKLLYGEAFRAPNPYERSAEHHAEHEGAHPHQLSSETIDTYEVVYERYFGKYRFSLSAYQYEVQDLITSYQAVEGGAQLYINEGDVHSHGVEVEVEGKLASGLQLRGSYALQKSEVESAGRELSSSPRHLAKLNLIMPLHGERLVSSIELQYRSSSLTLARTRSEDFLLTNVHLTARPFARAIELSLGAYNLFDTTVEYPASSEHLQSTIEQNGRTVEGRLLVRFGSKP